MAHDLWVGAGFRGSPQSARGGLTRLSSRVVFASLDGETVPCPPPGPRGQTQAGLHLLECFAGPLIGVSQSPRMPLGRFDLNSVSQSASRAALRWRRQPTNCPELDAGLLPAR